MAFAEVFGAAEPSSLRSSSSASAKTADDAAAAPDDGERICVDLAHARTPEVHLRVLRGEIARGGQRLLLHPKEKEKHRRAMDRARRRVDDHGTAISPGPSDEALQRAKRQAKVARAVEEESFLKLERNAFKQTLLRAIA